MDMIGKYQVSVTTMGNSGHGSGKYSVHWSVHEVPYKEGDREIIGGDSPAFDEPGAARAWAQREGEEASPGRLRRVGTQIRTDATADPTYNRRREEDEMSREVFDAGGRPEVHAENPG